MVDGREGEKGHAGGRGGGEGRNCFGGRVSGDGCLRMRAWVAGNVNRQAPRVAALELTPRQQIFQLQVLQNDLYVENVFHRCPSKYFV